MTVKCIYYTEHCCLNICYFDTPVHNFLPTLLVTVIVNLIELRNPFNPVYIDVAYIYLYII